MQNAHAGRSGNGRAGRAPVTGTGDVESVEALVPSVHHVAHVRDHPALRIGASDAQPVRVMHGASYRSGDSSHIAPAASEAGYRCDDCDKTFSADALKRVTVGRYEALACPFCGHGVRQAASGRVVAPFAPLLLGAFAFAIREPVAMVALGVTVGLLKYLPFGGWFGEALIVAYCFAIVRKTSVGGDRAPEAIDFVDFEGLFAPLVRYLLVVLLSAAPAIAATVAHAPFPLTVALALLGLSYAPAALIVASESEGLLVHPIAAVRIVARIARPYLVLLAGLAVVGGVQAGVSLVARYLEEALTVIPILPRLVATTLTLYAPFTAARMLGLLVREHAEDL
jgi:DNA-directed RNA polymerase subunit RPC12/RpoP